MRDYQPYDMSHIDSPPVEKTRGRDAQSRDAQSRDPQSAWSALALHSKPGGNASNAPAAIQRKAEIGAVDDPMEREADAVAARIVGMGEPCAIGSSSTEIQRKCAACENEEKIYAKRESGASGRNSGAEVAVHEASRGGVPLSQEARAFFEPRFSRDFGQVRIHTGGDAAEAARAVQARAFTYGRDIVFAAGEYSPNSVAGKELLAHELTHVVQQQNDPPSRGASAPSIGAAPMGIARDVGWAQRGPIADPYGMGYNDIYRRAGAASLSAVQDLASCEGKGMTFDRSVFETLSTTRRTAVLQLRSHAAGTACESWFVALAQTTAGGQFGIDTYKPHQSASGDVDKMVGAEIKFTFTPSLATYSDKIGFVQVLKPIELFENEKPRATKAADGEAGWALDRAEDRRSPIYGQNNTGDAGSNTHFGYRKSATDMDPAWIFDHTNEPRNQGQALAFQGTTFALDATHNAYLGGVHWGFNVSAAGAVTTTPVVLQSLAGPEGIQRRALELWNDQAKNPDLTQRNHPNQDQVPLP